MDYLKRLFKNRWFRWIGFPVLGACLGFGYYLVIGCSTNTCPITSSPYISSAYGAILGLLASAGNH